VLTAGADFGLWVDGDGEAVVLVDECGREVAPHQLLVVLASHLRIENPAGAVVLEPAAATRRSMAVAMAENQAVLGGGASGRYWLAPSPAPDALHLIAVLLTLLSTRDWPLSEVIARSLEPAGSCR
jgi:phosphomannomutase